MPLAPLIIPLISGLTSEIMKIVPPEHHEAIQGLLEQHKTDVEAKIAESESKASIAAAEVIKEEVKTGFWGNWRAVLMYLIMFIIFLNYGVATIISFFMPIRPFVLPQELWTLILISVPGYIGLETHEKGSLPGADLISKITDKILKR